MIHHSTSTCPIKNKELDSHEISSKFTVDEILGKGAFATVYRAKRVSKRRRDDSQSFSSRVRIYEHDMNVQNLNEYRGGTKKDHDGDGAYVSLKIVNVSKVSQRRRGQEVLESERIGNKYEPLHDQDGESLPGLSQTEYDTEQLFFPSRIQNKNNADMNQSDAFIKTKELLQREINVHSSVSKSKHPNIVSMLESFEYNVVEGSRKERNLMMVMVVEYCPLGDLHQYLKKQRNERNKGLYCNDSSKQSSCTTHTSFIDEKEIRHSLRHILRGLAFLHSRGIVHRDIKAANIFLTRSYKRVNEEMNQRGKSIHNDDTSSFTLQDCCLKIGDFGLAVQMSDDDDWDDAQHTLCGTPSCLAPEVALSSPNPKSTIKNNSQLLQSVGDSLLISCKDKGDKELVNTDVRGHGQPADLWSIGCILYVMLFAKYPFTTSKNVQVDSNGLRGNPPLPDKLMKIRETIQNVVNGNWSIPHNFQIQDASYKLLSQLLSKDPKSRGFARGILSSHIFFHEIKCRSMMNIPLSTKSNITCSGNPNVAVLKCLTNKVKSIDESPKMSFPEQQNTESTSHLSSSATLLMDQAKVARNNLHRKRSTKHHSKHFLTPIKELHRLPVLRYQWETEKCSQRSSEVKKIIFTIFILPERKGVVFQCEKIGGGGGVWMHLINDGKSISMGKLSKLPLASKRTENINRGNEDFSIVDEAFSRQPTKYKTFTGVTRNFRNTSDELQSMCTLGQVNISTCYSSPLVNSMQLSNYSKLGKNRYKQLSALLRQKNKSYLVVYKTMERFLKKIRRKLPKVHLSIFTKDIIKTSEDPTEKLLCIVTIIEGVENDAVTVQFLDGSKIVYNRSNGFTEIFLIGKDGQHHKVIDIYMNKRDKFSQIYQNIKLLKDEDHHTIASYLQFAHSAIKKCIEIESAAVVEGSSSSTLPAIRLVAVNGKSCKSWRDVTTKLLGTNTRKQFIEHLLQKILNDKYDNDMSNPLEPKFVP